MTTEQIEEIVEHNKCLQDHLADLSITHAKHRQRLDELISGYVRDKKDLAAALETEPIHWEMVREIKSLKTGLVADTYTKSYVSAPFGDVSAPLELVTLKRGMDDLAIIPAKLLREMFEELRPILDSENAAKVTNKGSE